jgi:hypothetical protein
LRWPKGSPVFLKLVAQREQDDGHVWQSLTSHVRMFGFFDVDL